VEQSGRPILIVEDDDTIRSALEVALGAHGYRVSLAANGAEALDRIAQERPSLVFLDMRMPVLDGWQFNTEAHARGFDPPIVVMTTREDAPRVAEELNAAGYLGKPFDLEELRACVRDHRIP